MGAPSTDWKESIADGEDAHLAKLAEQIRVVQAARNAKRKKKGRALHYKQHVGVTATLTVHDDLPPHASHGLFAKPHTYACYVRFSNGAGHVQPDDAADVRGLAVKVLGVGGQKVIPALENARTQDLLFINSSSTPFRNADEFVALVVAAAAGQLLLLPRFARRVGWGRAFGLIRQFLRGVREPFHSFARRRMFTALPFQCGPYAVRAALLPIEGARDSMPSIAAPSGMSALADDLSSHLRHAALEWDLALQFFVDEDLTPIEDASVDWAESDSPYLRVARLEIPPQDVHDPQGRQLCDVVDYMSFDPWHALVEHRPLGNMMRARNHAYRASAMERGAFDEPTEDASES